MKSNHSISQEDFSKMFADEDSFPRLFATAEVRDWGVMFYDEGLKSASKISPLILTSVSCETDLLNCPLARTELQSSNVVLATKFQANILRLQF